MQNRGKLIVISGPSGVGKGTVCEQLLQQCTNLFLSVSATTRAPRSVDIDGVTYHFKSRAEFQQMIEDGSFLEWAVYNGNYYGTPKAAVMAKLDAGENVLLEIDVQGALHVKENFPDWIYLFIAPPSKQILEERLRGRGTESEEEIEKRVAAAGWELEQQEKYDHVVVNGDLSDTVSEIEHILKADGVCLT